MTAESTSSSTKSDHPIPDPPKIVAVVDIGATAIRMAIAEINHLGEIRTLERVSQGVGLGKDTFVKGSIDPDTAEDCVRVLRTYRRLLAEYDITDVTQVHVVATSAVREASNRLSFLKRLYVATGFIVEPFDEAAVNRVTYLGVHPVLASQSELAEGRTLIVEVGGGSTEVLLAHGEDITYANTYRLGAMRLRRTLEAYRAPVRKLRGITESQVHRIVDQVRQRLAGGSRLQMLALGGDVRFATSQLLPDWDPQDLAVLPLAKLKKFTDKILELSVDEVVEQYRLAFAEAEGIGPALLTYAKLAEGFQLDEILVSSINLRDGLIKAMAFHESWTESFSNQIIRSATDLGRRFNFDESHSCHVAELAKTLFRELSSEHRLDHRFEVILTVAALLHDVGYAINARSHHKHSQYLIVNGEIFGLSKRDALLAGLTARYHRRAVPKPIHEGYASLDWESQTNVAKMAALLRVADALDRSNSQRIRDIGCVREGGQLIINVPSADDLSVEQLALRQKANLFRDIFGLAVVLRNADEA